MKVLSGLQLPSFAGNKPLISDGGDYIAEGGATATELSQLSGVNSNIQNQLNGKQSSPYVIGGLTVTGQTHWKIGSITFPGTALSSFAGILSVATSSMGASPGEIRFAIDLRRNASSLPTGGIIASSSFGTFRVDPDDIVATTNNAATDSNLVVDLYIKISGIPVWEFYQIQLSVAAGNAGFTSSTSYISGLPVSTWSTTSSSPLAGTGNRLAQVDSTGRFTASISVPSSFIQTLFDDITATSARATLGAIATSDVKEIYNWYGARPTDCNLAVNGNGGIRSFKATSTMTSNKPTQGDSHIIHLGWDNAGGYDSQLAISPTTGHIQIRGQNAGVWSSWATVWDSLNLTNINQLGIADGVFSISKTNGLQSALDGKLSTSGKAADSEYFDGIDSSRFVYGNTSAATSNLGAGVTFGSIVKSGFYDSTTASDSPSANTWTHILHGAHSFNPASWSWQLAANFINSNTENYFLRTKANGTWQPWRTIWTSKDFTNADLSNWDSAFANSHSHDQLLNTTNSPNFVGLSLYGNLYFGNPANGNFRGVQGQMGVNDQWRIMGRADSDNAGYLEIATSDDGNEPIYVRQYNAGTFGTVLNEIVLMDSNGNSTFKKILIAHTSDADNIRLGNAAYIGSSNTADTVTVRSINNSGIGYLQFGVYGPWIGYNGTDFMISNNLKSSYDIYANEFHGKMVGNAKVDNLSFNSTMTIDVSGSGGATLPTGSETGTMLIYTGQMNIQTDTLTIPTGEALWYRSQSGASSRLVGPNSISVNRQCITVIKFANEWRVSGLLYV